MLDLEFMRLAFAAGAIVGVLAPAVGFFLVQREMSLIGDGIGHVAFAGVAAGYLLGVSPVLTALAAAVIGAVSIEWLRARKRTAGDQALAIVFYTGIAARRRARLVGGRAQREPVPVPLRLDPDGDARRPAADRDPRPRRARRDRRAAARACSPSRSTRSRRAVSGLPVPLLNGVVAVLAALTIALSMRIVGILLIAALMVLPVIAAQRIAWSLRSTMAIAIAIGLDVGARRADDARTTATCRPAARSCSPRRRSSSSRAARAAHRLHWRV